MNKDKIIACCFTNELGNEIDIQVYTAAPNQVMNPAETIGISMQCPTSDTDWIMTEMEAKTLLHLLQLYFKESI